MLGSGDPTPYDMKLVALLGGIALLLLAGALSGGYWSPALALTVRRGGAIVAIGALATVLLLTPTRSGIVGAGRLVTIWPAFALVAILFAIWSWRAGRV
jgi:hypothetical protein